MYYGTQRNLPRVVEAIVLESGNLTDELMSADVGNGPFSIGATGNPVDERVLPEQFTPTNSDFTTRTSYGSLQKLRGYTLQAIGLLQAYAPDVPALRSEMYALQGYAEILLGELYCSGVPLSTLDFQKDFTYKPSSTETEVYQHALALLDSALAISTDSPSVTWLANVAKGRVLLDLARYPEAAQAVAMVPDTFRYQVVIQWGDVGGGYPFVNPNVTGGVLNSSVANNEGINGLPFSSSSDPRTPVIPAGTNVFGVPLFDPAQYPPSPSGVSMVTLASGVEARLIGAEAAFNANSNNPVWLTILNALRTTCADAASCPTPAPAGIGGVDSLPPLNDPGTDSARVTLLFNERAYWLFLTGHRQGDLRRLVRNYGRPQNRVYPTGAYFGGQGTYGSDVALPIPASERSNPLFHGCLDRRA